jgi:ribosome-binding factor A
MRKVNEAVREALAVIISRDMKDPRLELVTVTSVEVTGDLRHATVYVTAHGDEERYDDALAGLQSGRGRIRALLGERVDMRFTPELDFRIDESVDQGMRIAEILHEHDRRFSGTAETDESPDSES